jgi:sugar phosphate isomerase/epimerase
MKLCTTTKDFAYYCDNDIDRIKEIKRAGFKYVDYSMIANEAAAYMHSGWRDDAKRLKDAAEEIGVEFVQMHSPEFETLETIDPSENWQEKLEQTIRTIEVACELGIKSTVVHAGVKRYTDWEETKRLNKEFYQLLLPTMEKTGVNVLVENVGKSDNTGRCFLNTGDRVREFVEYFNHPLLHACWDIGHGNAIGNQCEEIKKVNKHIYAIHYNDNWGGNDSHTIPFLGTADHEEILRTLIDIGFDGPLTFEAVFVTFPRLMEFDKKTGREKKSIEIRRAYEKVLFETGKYMLEAFDVYEE